MRVGAEGRERQARETRAGTDRDATRVGTHAQETERCGPPHEAGAAQIEHPWASGSRT